MPVYHVFVEDNQAVIYNGTTILAYDPLLDPDSVKSSIKQAADRLSEALNMPLETLYLAPSCDDWFWHTIIEDNGLNKPPAPKQFAIHLHEGLVNAVLSTSPEDAQHFEFVTFDYDTEGTDPEECSFITPPGGGKPIESYIHQTPLVTNSGLDLNEIFNGNVQGRETTPNTDSDNEPSCG